MDETLQQVASAREQTRGALKERAEIEARAEKQLKSVEEQSAEQLKSTMTEMAEIKAREAKRLRLDEHPPKLNQGNNIVNQDYVESFTMNDREIQFVFSNKTAENLKPKFDFLLINKDGHITATVDFNWTDDPIKPGDTRVGFEAIPALRSGAPVAYSIRFLSRVEEPAIAERKDDHSPARSAPLKEEDTQSGDDAILRRIEETFKKLDMRITMRQGIFRDLCLAERKAIREADRLYPLPEHWRANMRYHDEMTPKYEKLVRQKYRLSKEQEEMIALEAAIRRWPVPKDSSPD